MNRYLIAGAAGLTLAVAGVAGAAGAATHKTLNTASNAGLGKSIVVDSRGLTVYELKGEGSYHLLCKTKACFANWPMVTVKSAKTKPTAVKGVTGRLGVLHRNGKFQVTLAGHPLYRFAGDSSKKGATNGEGIKAFGGTWHVVAASSSTTSTTTTTTTDTTPPPYPGY
jgi:predicted lipoprotein with Yx(FWY)xxD motif